MSPRCLGLIQLWIWVIEITHLMMNDLMLSDFRLPHLIPYWDIFPFRLRFTNLHGIAWSSPPMGYMPRWWPICYLIMIPQWSLSRAIQLDPHFSAFGCHHVSSPRLRTWMARITHLVMDDLAPSDFLTCHTSEAILRHFSFWLRFVDLHWFAWSFPFTRYMSSWWSVFLFYDDSLVKPFLSHSVKLILSDIVVILWWSYVGCIDSHIIILVEYMSNLLYIPMELFSSYQDRLDALVIILVHISLI